MYAAPVPVAQSSAKSAWPLAAICCLGLLGFLIVATIVLALIPVYLPNNATPVTNRGARNLFALAQANAAAGTQGGTVQNPGALAGPLGVGGNGQVVGGTAQPRRAARKRAAFNRRQTTTTVVMEFVFEIAPILAPGCSSDSCVSATISGLQQSITNVRTFTASIAIITASGVVQTTSFTITILSFASTRPTDFGTGSGTSSDANTTAAAGTGATTSAGGASGESTTAGGASGESTTAGGASGESTTAGGASGESTTAGGASGASGESTTAGGASGASGESTTAGGASGASGESTTAGGASGASGESTTAGGASGASTSAGASGASGASTSAGASGASTSAGASGASGASTSAGASGASGASTSSGASGASGASTSSGASGASTSSGASGASTSSGGSTTAPTGPTPTSFSSAQSGPYFATTTWAGGIIPTGNVVNLTIAAGHTVTIALAAFNGTITTWLISGTLELGRGFATFTFQRPTSIIIRSGGQIVDATNNKRIVTAQGTAINQLSGGTLPAGTDIEVGVGARAVGSTFRITASATATVGILGTDLRAFNKTTPICNSNGGDILAATSFLGAVSASIEFCSPNVLCGLDIFASFSLVTASLNGRFTLNVGEIFVAASASLSLGTPGSTGGFTFPGACQIQASGRINFAAAGGSLRLAVGGALNLAAGASIVSVSGAAVALQTISLAGADIGVAVTIQSGQAGPLFVSPTPEGVKASTQTPGGNDVSLPTAPPTGATTGSTSTPRPSTTAMFG